MSSGYQDIKEKKNREDSNLSRKNGLILMKDLQNEILEMEIPNNSYKKKKWKISKETRQ